MKSYDKSTLGLRVKTKFSEEFHMFNITFINYKRQNRYIILLNSLRTKTIFKKKN